MYGGTQIPDNSDMNSYDEYGNYYCSTDESSPTLKNAPFTEAFTMTVEAAAGTKDRYPAQVYRRLIDGAIAYRYYSNKQSKWMGYVYFSDDATVLGQTITYSDYTIPAGGTMTIEEGLNNLFYQLAIFRGSVGVGYNAVLFTGYGTGGSDRFQYKILDDGSAISISVSDTSFIISNETISGSLTMRIFDLYGNSPIVSAS